jgi:hypothetical protein
VAYRTATFIVLFAVLVAGILTPTGMCALMCERHARAERQPHCVQPMDTMPGMAHGHSAMNHAAVEDMSPGMAPQSCRANCVTAERLDVSRKVILPVTVVKTEVVVQEASARFVTAGAVGAWSSDSSPPAPPAAYSASFSILRI